LLFIFQSAKFQLDGSNINWHQLAEEKLKLLLIQRTQCQLILKFMVPKDWTSSHEPCSGHFVSLFSASVQISLLFFAYSSVQFQIRPPVKETSSYWECSKFHRERSWWFHLAQPSTTHEENSSQVGGKYEIKYVKCSWGWWLISLP
jgi:hypothetical protein